MNCHVFLSEQLHQLMMVERHLFQSMMASNRLWANGNAAAGVPFLLLRCIGSEANTSSLSSPTFLLFRQCIRYFHSCHVQSISDSLWFTNNADKPLFHVQFKGDDYGAGLDNIVTSLQRCSRVDSSLHCQWATLPIVDLLGGLGSFGDGPLGQESHRASSVWTPSHGESIHATVEQRKIVIYERGYS